GGAVSSRAAPPRQGGPRAPPGAFRRRLGGPSAGTAGLAACGERRGSEFGAGTDRADPRRTAGYRILDDYRDGRRGAAPRRPPAAARPASVRAGRPAARGRAFSRSLASRSRDLGRIGAVAQPGSSDAPPRHADAAGQCAALRALVGALARAAGVGAAGSASVRALSGP